MQTGKDSVAAQRETDNDVPLNTGGGTSGRERRLRQSCLGGGLNGAITVFF